MRCFDCQFWQQVRVNPGTRRVVGHCIRPDGPQVHGRLGEIGRWVYGTWMLCTAGVEASPKRAARLHKLIARSNARLDRRFGVHALTDDPGWRPDTETMFADMVEEAREREGA